MLDIETIRSTEKDNEAALKKIIHKYKKRKFDQYNYKMEYSNIDILNKYVKFGYFEFRNREGILCYAVNNLKYLDKIKSYNQDYVFFITKKEMHDVFSKNFSEQKTDFALNHLNRVSPKYSAKNIDYSKYILLISFVFINCFVFLSYIFNIFNNIIYLSYTILKTILLYVGIKNFKTKNAPLNQTQDLPVYTILIPLYREVHKVDSILKAIKNINYPADKLDVKIIIEEDDILTKKALIVNDIAEYIHIIKVPYSLPRTKPKAMNYALNLASGKYLTIYDAEDEPEPNQLLKAVSDFENLPKEYACLQARLNFYNARFNILTRFFSMEYGIWFNFLMKALDFFRMPITLGGTSNHFKTDILKKIGAWDAYNVTEDADLGLRFYLNGYKIKMLDSCTMEEAPTNITDWLLQRARWIKGYIQTIFVFNKSITKSCKIPVLHVICTYFYIGFSVYMFLFNPILIMYLFLKSYDFIYNIWIINGIVALIYTYSSVCAALCCCDFKFVKFSALDICSVILWPFYFILHSLAAYRAIWELFTTPFSWNKTPHGIDEQIIPIEKE